MLVTGTSVKTAERDALALDALHHLSAQFAADPDFASLIRSLLLTLSGQFAVPGVMAIMRLSGVESTRPSIYAVGPFDHLAKTTARDESYRCWTCMRDTAFLCTGNCASEVESYEPKSRCLRSTFDLSLVVPLVHKQRVFGFVGVGKKHTGESLGHEERSRLEAIISSVIPLLTNSYLLSDVLATKRWYASLMDNVPQAVFVCDGSGRLKIMNHAARNLTGYSPAEDPNQSTRLPQVEELLSDIDLPRVVRNFLRDPAAALPEPCSVPDRRTGRVYSLSASRVSVDTGECTDKVLNLDDITQARETESHLLDLEKLAERGSMVSSIAHEIRNVLAVLHGGIELSQIALKKGDVTKTENYLNRVLDSARHLERFSLELMDTKKGQSQRVPTSLNDLVVNVVTFLKVQRRFKAITFAVELDPQLPAVEADSDQITQLLMNFFNNSADAIREAKRLEGRITVSTSSVSGSVHLVMADNGCGMPAEVRDKLFLERFTTKEDGHGYGLVTCARIISSHQATIKVDSEEGESTRIQVVFPTR